jgi:hypothetical protein
MMGWMAPLRRANQVGPHLNLGIRPIKSGTSLHCMSLGERPRDSQETFGRACKIGHRVLARRAAADAACGALLKAPSSCCP